MKTTTATRNELLNTLDMARIEIGDWVKHEGQVWCVDGMSGARYQQTANAERTLSLARGNDVIGKVAQDSIVITQWATEAQRRYMWIVAKGFTDAARRNAWQTLANMEQGFTKAQAMVMLDNYQHANKHGMNFEQWQLEPSAERRSL